MVTEIILRSEAEIELRFFFQWHVEGGLREIYHLAKFHRSTPTHARDIPYKKSCGHTRKKQTDRQTVTDISTTCLSACVDNKNIVSLCDINEHTTYTVTHRTFYKTPRNDQKCINFTVQYLKFKTSYSTSTLKFIEMSASQL